MIMALLIPLINVVTKCFVGYDEIRFFVSSISPIIQIRHWIRGQL